MLTAALYTLVHTALAAPNRCTVDGTARIRVVLATAPWREGTLLAEACMIDPEHPSTGDWERLLFIRNDGQTAWTKPLGSEGATSEVWWSTVDLLAQDVDGDEHEEVIVRGQLSNCGVGGCVAGDARLYVWPGVADDGGDCGRRGFGEGERGRLLTWANARFDVPGWAGPSWVRTAVTRAAPGSLDVREVWTALPPAFHDPIVYDETVYASASGVVPHCATRAAPGM